MSLPTSSVRKSKQLVIVLAIFLVFGAMELSAFWNKNREALSEREVAMRVLGEYLKKNFHPAKVLVISNPFTRISGRPPEVYSFQRASEKGLRKALGGDTEARIVFPKLLPEATLDPRSIRIDPKSKTPLVFMIAQDAFEELIKTNGDCEVVVSIIGLPLNSGLRDFWKPGGPKFALLLPDLRALGDLETIRRSFISGKIAAAVIARPAAKSDEKVGSDYKVEFEKRFLLVTAENVDAMLPLLLQ